MPHMSSLSKKIDNQVISNASNNRLSHTGPRHNIVLRQIPQHWLVRLYSVYMYKIK